MINIFKTEKLKFNTVGAVKKYKLTSTSELQINSLLTKSIVETKWSINIKNILDHGYIIDVITYDHQLVETNNEAFGQLALITEQFNQLYNEVTILVDKQGNLKKVLNKEQLKEKWSQIKNKAIKYFNEETDLESYFTLNDKTFEQPGFIENMVKEMEFFLIYFQAGYGYSLNSSKVLERDNAYRTNKIAWNLNFEGKESYKQDYITIMGLEGKARGIDEKWSRKAYGQFPFLNVANLNPTFNLKGKYIINNETGMIKNGILLMEEIAHPTLLFNKIKYSLEEIINATENIV